MSAQRSGTRTLAAAGGEEGAQIGGAQGVDVGDFRRTCQMSGQKRQKLARIAFIGIERVSRKPAFARQALQPFAAFFGQIGCGDNQQFVQDLTR